MRPVPFHSVPFSRHLEQPNSEAQTGERFKRDKEEQEKQDKIAARKIKRLEREEKNKRDNEELQRRLPQDAGDGQR